MHLNTLLALFATGVICVSAQVESCSTDNTCFGSGPTSVDLNAGISVVDGVCSLLQGSYINDEQRHWCAFGTVNTKFDFNVRRTGSGTGSLDVQVCSDAMKGLLGADCSGGLGGRKTVGDFQFTADPNNGMCSDINAIPTTPTCPLT